MQIIYNDIFLEHETGEHPENKKRLLSIEGKEETDISDGTDYLNLVHTKDYIASVKALSDSGGGMLDADTVVSQSSYKAAVFAAGAAIDAAQQNGFALTRPPGHHAYPDRGSGFCLFNNIAVAVKKLVTEGKRVCILDFDGHCGDGTEHIFYGSEDVLYCSLHQSPAFPHKGHVDEIGVREGRGFTVNVPLPPNSGDDLFFRGFDLCLSIARQFAPDHCAVSAGFDAHIQDPLLNLCLSTSAYYEIGKKINENFTNIFAVLEGGYHLEYLPYAVENFLCGINGKPIAYSDQKTETVMQVYNEFDHRLSDLIRNLSGYWKL